MGFVSLVLGMLGVSMLGWIDLTVARMFSSSVAPSLFLLLLVGEAAIVLLVGSYLVLLSRERRERPCRRCNYELMGLDDPNPTCPECGLAHAAVRVRNKPCATCGTNAPTPDGQTPRCGACEAAAPESVQGTAKPHSAVAA